MKNLKVDFIRLFLRLCCLGFILGRFKKRESKNGQERGFVTAVCPRPAGRWIIGNDFLWKPKQKSSKEIKEGDIIVFFGYRKSSGWKAKLVVKLF